METDGAVWKTEIFNLTEGGIVRKLLFIAVPIMGTQFVQMAYNLTDMFWLGRVGSGAVAASGAAGMYMWLSFGFTLIGRMGAEIGVAQSLGRGDRKAALAFSQNALFMGAAVGIAFALCLIIFRRELIGFFRFREKDVASDAARYLLVVSFGMPAAFISNCLIGTFNGSGNSGTPFILGSSGLLVNVILDPFFIFTLDMGVTGAAAATLISQILVVLLTLWSIVFYRNRPFKYFSFRIRPEKSRMLLILKWSLPIGIESIVFCLLAMATSRVETSFGAHAVAVSKIGSQIESLSWLIGGGFSSAMVAFIGQNYGAQKWDRIARSVRLSVVIMTIWGILVTLFLWTLGGFVFSLFLPDPPLVRLGVIYLRIFSFAQLPMNLEGVGAGAFKGTGRTIPPSLASVLANLTKPVLAYALSRTALGLYGVWIAVSAATVIRGLWIFLWYFLSDRKRAHLAPPRPYPG
ncbi:MAG: MATE family efflux transporter [Treponema sp.]|jgi:putative MATE family efflux protein|nr:MATE family efflux transporter [Treponema sp.]